MYNAQNWERWVNRELLHQLAAKGKIEAPKGEATERYVRTPVDPLVIRTSAC